MDIKSARFYRLNKRFVSYLHSKNCNVNIVKQMISQGADVNYRDSSRNTPMHIVFQHCGDKLNLVRELLAAGGNLNACNSDERSAVHYAVMYADDVEVLRELIGKGADLHLLDSDDNSPLHLAVQYNKKTFVEALIHSESELKVKNLYEETPLMIAVRNNNLEIVKVILSSVGCESLLHEIIACGHPLPVAVECPVPNQSILIELMEYGANMCHWNLCVSAAIKHAVQKFCADPSYSLLSARTLLKCCVLQHNPFQKIPCLFSYLKNVLCGRDIYPQLSDFTKKCMAEKEKMKLELIHKNFCLFDFVREGFERNPLFQRKTAYRERIINHILYISRKYPVYADVIAYRLGKLDLCLKSMDLCVYTLKECPAGKWPIFLTPDVVFLISGFLPNVDVLNFITAFSDFQHSGAHDFGFQNLALGKSTKRKLNWNC